MTLAVELAKRICALRFDDLPADVVHWAKVGIVDTAGVTLAGSGEVDTSVELLQRVLPFSTGPSLIFGSARRTSTLDAAMINGTASHALDFDDCNNTFCGHPSAPILPALFALSDEQGARGDEFLNAYVAGFETECKIALGASLYQYTHGWHPTSTVGVFGAAASCARLLQLDENKTATSLAIAASFASGIKANFGTMTKPLHVGQCARNGLLAALLAREGFTANLSAFEHSQGYFEAFNGSGNYDSGKILPAWGAPFDLARPGLGIKQYPCCGSTHPALDAMLELVRTHDLTSNSVARIEAWIHKRRLEHTNRPEPRSALDAKFSLQYCLARALKDRAISMEHFEHEAFRDPEIHKILARVHVAPYTAAQFPEDNHFAGEVRVTTTSGDVLVARVDQALGRTVDAPLPEERLRDKFEACALRVLSAEASREVYEAIRTLEKITDVRQVTALLEAGVRPRQVKAASFESTA
jgi:2-methylcitrate dehydratase PrpD